MIRNILRYTQNTLVLSSALLVVLALQRMQSFDYHQNPLNDHLSHHEEDSGEAFDSHGGPDHHVFFGREFSIGLFRFVLPRLESVEVSPAARNLVKQRHTSSSKEIKVTAATEENAKEVKVTAASEESATSTVAYLIEIADCSAHVLDSLAVLQHSVSSSTKRENYQLHALLPGSLIPICGPALQKLGYRTVDRGDIIVPNSLQQHKSDTCLSHDVKTQLYSMQLKVDLVVKAPLPSFVFPIESGEEGKQGLDTEAHDGTNEKHVTAAHVLVPGDDALKILTDDVLRHCSLPTPGGDSVTFSQSSWSLCGSTCKLVEHGLKIVDFSECTMPWECHEEDYTTERNSPQCRLMRDKWFQLRHDMEQDQLAGEKTIETTAEDLFRKYCAKQGLEGYVPMLQASQTQPEQSR